MILIPPNPSNPERGDTPNWWVVLSIQPLLAACPPPLPCPRIGLALPLVPHRVKHILWFYCTERKPNTVPPPSIGSWPSADTSSLSSSSGSEASLTGSNTATTSLETGWMLSEDLIIIGVNVTDRSGCFLPYDLWWIGLYTLHQKLRQVSWRVLRKF